MPRISTFPEKENKKRKKAKRYDNLIIGQASAITECSEELTAPPTLTPTTKLTATTPKSVTPGGLMLKYLKKSTEESPVSS